MAYFWPQMKKEVQMCVKTCHVCRQVKGESQADEAKLLDASQVLHDLQRREAEYVLGDRLEQGRGVPPKQHYLRCHYEVLGLGRDYTTDEIRSAYCWLALQRHPDKLSQFGFSPTEDTVLMAPMPMVPSSMDVDPPIIQETSRPFRRRSEQTSVRKPDIQRRHRRVGLRPQIILLEGEFEEEYIRAEGQRERDKEGVQGEDYRAQGGDKDKQGGEEEEEREEEEGEYSQVRYQAPEDY
ncbi:hypothetical protein RJ640_014561 [Escallonia rubra]|uniref:J domain-containing protein n=1 Tax=Escallonia rubra TaxID=112253 RepID=A0AA88R167_9ASTE|nr:hypothetical protein RJ640_014561 [Escallonia rubra]